MSFLQFILFTINEHTRTFVGVVLLLIGAWVPLRYNEIKIKREKFEKEYSEFKKPFIDFIEGCLNIEDVSLNASFLNVFRQQERAKNTFIHNLHGILRRRRLNAFNKNWAEYEEEYQAVKRHGIFAPVVAIAPSIEALQNSSPEDAPKWESDRKKILHNLINDLLKVSNLTIWF